VPAAACWLPFALTSCSMDPLDDRTLFQLASLISGQDGPVYRSKPDLARFFAQAGLEFESEERVGRQSLTLQHLRRYNASSEAISKVLLRLADPREYAGDVERIDEVLRRLNRLLSVEGLHVELEGARPHLKEGAFAMVARQDSSEPTPEFTKLTGDPEFAALLADRWREARICLEAGAYLSCIVMMGSLLEGALLAVLERSPAKANQALRAPRDQTGKARPYRDWGLGSLFEVAHELGLVQSDARHFSSVLRDYRNAVHPESQRRSKLSPDQDTCAICWQVVKATINDLLTTY
jgi:hypothetical protein